MNLQPCSNREQSGVALLAVMWLSLALTLMAMTTAFLVRTEAHAVGNHLDAERAEWLARGGLQAALYNLLRRGDISDSQASAGPSLRQALPVGQRWMRFEMEQGAVVVEVVPENAKLNINTIPVEQLAALFARLGVAETGSRELAAAIADWRSPRASSVATTLDAYYASLSQPYEPRHAPFDELEELLAVRGMTRELYYGQLIENPDGTLRRTPPLADLLTTEPVFGGVNIHYAAYEVLQVLPGWSEAIAAAVVEARAQGAPGTLLEQVPGLSAAVALSGANFAPSPAYTLTATAQMRGSNVRRTVRARVRLERQVAMGFRITAWWEDGSWSAAAGAQLDQDSIS